MIMITMRPPLLLLVVLLTHVRSQCHFSCTSCSVNASSTSCLTCDSSTNHRQITGSFTCDCMVTYA